MKQIFFAAAMLLSATSFAQTGGSKLPDQVLSSYYGIRDALVNANASGATAQAKTFIASLSAVDAGATPEKENIAALKTRLSADAQRIVKTGKIDAQREAFANLSQDLWNLLKAAGSQGKPLYRQYCPMKKAYWISAEPAIRNPYYGKQMLTCGKTADTLQ